MERGGDYVEKQECEAVMYSSILMNNTFDSDSDRKKLGNVPIKTTQVNALKESMNKKQQLALNITDASGLRLHEY